MADNRINGIYVQGDTIYVATFGGGLSISHDGGKTFVNRTIENGLGSNHLSIVFMQDKVVYVAPPNGLSISTD